MNPAIDTIDNADGVCITDGGASCGIAFANGSSVCCTTGVAGRSGIMGASGCTAGTGDLERVMVVFGIGARNTGIWAGFAAGAAGSRGTSGNARIGLAGAGRERLIVTFGATFGMGPGLA